MIILPDIHFGLQPSYIRHMDYANYILNTVVRILSNNPNERLVTTGDIWEDAGKCSKYGESERMHILNKNAVFSIGNGKHANNVYTPDFQTFEHLYGFDLAYIHVDDFLVGFLGHCKTQEELEEKQTYLEKNRCKLIVSHNFGRDFPNQPVMRNFKDDVLYVLGHDHTFGVLQENVICLGSLVNTDFGSAGEKYYLRLDSSLKYELIPVPHLIPFNTYEFGIDPKEIDQKGINRMFYSLLDDLAPYRKFIHKFVLKETDKTEVNYLPSSDTHGTTDLSGKWETFSDGAEEPVVKLGKEVLE